MLKKYFFHRLPLCAILSLRLNSVLTTNNNTMKKRICIIILLLACRICEAQNFVPNGSFELYNSCPTSVNQVDSVWFCTNPTDESPDYFNVCGTHPVGVPYNMAGFQQPHSGNAYCGLCLFMGTTPSYEFREYIELTLWAPLVQGEVYHFQMYVCISDNHRYSSDDFGVYFSDTLIDGMTSPLYAFSPQITNNSGSYPDTMNWSLVSANYTATGGEKYMIIGNFKNDANTSFTQISNNVYTYAYLLVDDVSLTQITGVDDLNTRNSIIINPNPFKDKLIIDSKKHDLLDIVLYDTASRKLLQQKFTNSVTINTEQLARGLYLFEVRDKNGLCKKGKLVKD